MLLRIGDRFINTKQINSVMFCPERGRVTIELAGSASGISFPSVSEEGKAVAWWLKDSVGLEWFEDADGQVEDLIEAYEFYSDAESGAPRR